MHPAERWRAPSLPPRSAASSTAARQRPPIDDWRPHIGRKVSIRYRLHDDTHPFSEAIGVVMNVTSAPDEGQLLKILSKHGVTIEVHTRDLIAAKLFPV